MTKYFVYPYTQNSAGSIMLAEELDGKRVKLQNSAYTHKPENVLINWGNGNCPYPQALNPASAINDVIDKVKFFKTLAGTGLIPPVAYTQQEAANLSFPVVCRTLTEAADGQGIVIADSANQLVPAKLYTSYINKTSEYRIHVGRKPDGEVLIICRQKKYKTPQFTGDGRIWTGPETKFSYIDTAIGEVIHTAKEAFAKFPELTFGAFDIVYDNSTETAYVLEINSAPMMNSDTTKAYGEFFKKYYTGNVPVNTSPTTVEITPMPATHEMLSPTPAPVGLTGFVKAQLAAGHITTQQLLAAYTPPQPTQDELVENYVNKITAG